MDMQDHIKSLRSEQLRADDLLAGPKTIVITEVKGTCDKNQPVAISYEGDQGRPYLPCLTMRRIIVLGWGSNPEKYVNRKMTLYRDDSVVYGGLQVGGIRISHMSDMNGKIQTAIMVAKGKWKKYEVDIIKEDSAQSERVTQTLSTIAEASANDLPRWRQSLSRRLASGDLTQEQHDQIMAALEARHAQLSQPTT